MDRREEVYREIGAAVEVPDRAGIVPAALDITPSPPGFPACANCGTALTGPFCAQCGQHVADYHQSVWRFLADFLDNTFCWDNKLLRTLGPLFRQPGFLTREFMAGRRARYVHPLRLFLFTSAVCITLIQINSGSSDKTPRHPHGAKSSPEASAKAKDADPGHPDATPQPTIPPEAAAVLAGLGVPVPGASPSPSASPTPGDSPGASASPSAEAIKAEVQQALQKKFGDEKGKEITDWGDEVRHEVGDKINEGGGIERVSRNVAENFRQRFSWVALGLLPVFALMLRALYWRKDTYYFLHLVFSLHYHTFLLMFWTAHNWLDTLLHHTGLHFLAKWYLLAAPVYLYLALQQVYGGSVRRTWAKVAILGGMHLLAIAIGLAAVGGLSVFMAMW